LNLLHHELAHVCDRLMKTVKGFNVPELKSLGHTHTAPEAKPDDLPSHEGTVEIAEGRELTLSFDGERCIHARFCVMLAPKVFKANTPGKWIFPDEMSGEDLMRVANICPSGAITYKRKDGGPDETAPPVNTIYLRENGPYAFHGPLSIDDQDDGFRATLCRCGASKNKPWCDGSHKDIDFKASGEPATIESEPLAVRDGPIDIELEKNGPLRVRANLEICTGTGRTVDRVSSAKLCRCGASRTKPFCDNTHIKIGFKTE
jgi:CDGSH-type Zn-finger protein/uncharacterized Fe-S cluster protein YjdI